MLIELLKNKKIAIREKMRPLKDEIERLETELREIDREIRKIRAKEKEKFTDNDSPKGETVPGVRFRYAA